MRYRTRRIPRYSAAINVYQFQSLKMQRSMACESSLEFDHLFYLERDKTVAQYQVQPVTVSYLHRGRMRSYTPDVLIVREDGSLLLREVKPHKKLENCELKEKLLAVRAACLDRGVGFEVVTDEHIRCQPLLATLRTLYRHAGKKDSRATGGTFLCAVGENGSVTLGEAYELCDRLEISRSTPLALMFHGQLQWLHDKPLSKDLKLDVTQEALPSSGK
ncbi:TnsA endonuclease N-terminal domain-containing protein [Ectothiorhodospiraceae bacterium WFHF3C12]|nr:TnsA endonuclease N-terminal domain-containing protein [Ectothiorhodospiraceae bacterium WFHF3C12]